MRKYVYLGFFLCLTLAGCVIEDGKRKKMANVNSYETNEDNSSKCHQASKKKKTFDYDNPYQTTVEMRYATDDRTVQQNIVICHGCRNKESVDSFYASYTAINCKSALWVVREITNFINLNRSTTPTFNTEFLRFATEIRSNVERFISILLNFLEKIADSSFYMDKSVLKAFISLKIKISLMSDCSVMGCNKTQQEIIALLLVETVELQRYSSVHCDYTTERTSKIPDYFPVWVFNDDATNMEVFFSITANTGLESDGPLNNCHARQILLEGIVEFRGTDEVSATVLNVMLAEVFWLTIRQFADVMLVSYDVDVISWYHDSILAAIMKLLCHVALKNKNALSGAAKNTIDEINQKILVDKDVLPAYFTEGFDLLRGNVDVSKLNSYSDRLRDYYVEPSTDGMTVLADRLLERIHAHFDQITCSEKYLKHLRGENDKYYTPGSHNRNTLLMDYSLLEELAHATDEFKPTACELIVRLYIYVFRHNDYDDYVNEVKMTHAMTIISDFCILVIQNERDNWHLVRTAYDVAVLLRNLKLVSRSKKDMLFLYQRAMDRVMSELNLYRTKYCWTTTYEYLAIDSDVKQYRDERAFWGFMQNFFKTRYGADFPELETCTPVVGSDRYFRVDYLYENYVKNSEVVKRYSNVVRVNWNRRLLSVDEIFAESAETTLDPRNAYALYDVYNKFFLAVIFHEARRELVGSDYESLELESAILTTAFDFNKFHDIFPDGLAALKTDLSIIFSFPYTRNGPDGTVASEMSASDAVSKLQNAVSDAGVKFVQYNFVISEDADEQPSTSNQTPLEGGDFLAVLQKDVNVLVRKFNIEFQQLRRFY